MNKGGTVVVPKQRSALSKIVSTCIVFLVTLVVVGGMVAFCTLFSGTCDHGPDPRKMGIPVQEQSPAENTEPNSGALAKDSPTKPEEVMLEEEHFQRLRISGIRILPIEGDKGLQVISFG